MIAYNAPEDHGAFYRAGGNVWGYARRWITGDVNEQIQIYQAAVKSRNINNSGTPDPEPYCFPTYNCGSWAQTICTRVNVPFPSNFINLGTGLVGPMALTGIPTLLSTAAGGWDPPYDSLSGGIDFFDFGF
jgi:hypothetical protein